MEFWERKRYELQISSRGREVRVVKELLHWNMNNPYRDDRSNHFTQDLAVCRYNYAKSASNSAERQSL